MRKRIALDYNGKVLKAEIYKDTPSKKSICIRITTPDKHGNLFTIADGYAEPYIAEDNMYKLPKIIVSEAFEKLGIVKAGETFRYKVGNVDQSTLTQQPTRITYDVTVGSFIDMVSVINTITGDVAMFSSYEEAIKYSIGKTVSINTVKVPMTNTPVVTPSIDTEDTKELENDVTKDEIVKEPVKAPRRRKRDFSKSLAELQEEEIDEEPMKNKINRRK